MGSELGVTADSKAEAVYTPVSIWWACWAVIWTLAVASGMAYLIVRRDAPVLRVRGLGFSLSAMGFLHLYFASVQFGVMAGPLLPGDAEFWIMGIWLNIGMALFYASNTRFLHVAKLQKKFVRPESRLAESPPDARKSGGLISRFHRLSYTTKTLITVGIAVFVQLFLVILMWIISRKWHSSWGIPGTEVHGTEMEQKTEMGRGWEWWPTIFWQFFWSWIVAPIVLWKARNIHDTQGWRVQTIGCAIANLHGTPLWLIGLYVPAMEKVNQYWLPPQWICLSIIIMEIFTVFLPCWEVIRHQALRKDTLDTIAQWETKTKASTSDGKSLNSTSTVVDSILSGWKSTTGSFETNSTIRQSILNMTALEYVLERNPAPLQEFSALHDFSGENIAFLTSVIDWKNSLPQAVRDNPSLKDENIRELIRERFNRALQIYAEFISIQHAEFPVNISSHQLKKLHTIFNRPACILYGDERDVEPATLFDGPGYAGRPPPSPTGSEGSEKAIRGTVSALRDRVQYWDEVPEEFGPTVFDDAEKSIKYLVLTNTWPKFVKARKTSSGSSDTLKNDIEMV